MESALLVTSLKFGKDGFVIGLPGCDEMIEDAGEFMSRILDGLGRAVPSALRPVIVAEVGFAVVKALSRQAKGLGDAVFGFDLGAADAASRAGAIFRTDVQPGGETVRSVGNFERSAPSSLKMV